MDYPQRVTGVDDELGADPPHAWVEVGRWPTAARADEFALVLQARGIRSAVATTEAEFGNQHQLIVRLEDAERARDELSTFSGENRGWPLRSVISPPVTMGVGAALVYVALMVIAFAAERQRSYGIDWLFVGSADAALIRSGEWWRVVTALSLHGDGVHLSGNLLFGALFGVMLAQSVGSGSTWLTFIVAGGCVGGPGDPVQRLIRPIMLMGGREYGLSTLRLGFTKVRDRDAETLNDKYFANRTDGLSVGDMGHVLTAWSK